VAACLAKDIGNIASKYRVVQLEVRVPQKMDAWNFTGKNNNAREYCTHLHPNTIKNDIKQTTNENI